MRKTMRVSEIRAAANRYLAASDPKLAEFRQGVAAMYEHLSMAAGDYHGYNDIVQLWAGEPGDGTYIPDESHRRLYFGAMTGPDAELAEAAIKAYRTAGLTDELPAGTDPEILRRRNVLAALTGAEV